VVLHENEVTALSAIIDDRSNLSGGTNERTTRNGGSLCGASITWMAAGEALVVYMN
jgi:hypothetical protein